MPLAPIPELESPNRDTVMNLVVDAFDNKTFIDEITPSLQVICQLVIKAATNEDVARAVSKFKLAVIKLLKDRTKSYVRLSNKRMKLLKLKLSF